MGRVTVETDTPEEKKLSTDAKILIVALPIRQYLFYYNEFLSFKENFTAFKFLT